MNRDDALQDNEKAQEGRKGCRRYWLWVVVILVLLVVAYLLWWGLLRPEPAVDCVIVNKRLVGIAQPVPGEPPYLVSDQVVVTGPAWAVEDVLSGPSLDNLESIRECDLNYLSERWEQRDSAPPRYLRFLQDGGNTPTTRLYHIPDGRSVEEVVAAINQEGSGSGVHADPNLLTGLAHGACGNPHSGEGSPFGDAPAPLDEVGEEAAKLFWGQWAFQQVGVSPSLDRFSRTAMQRLGTAPPGEAVIVGVFDTSPFPDPWDGVSLWRIGDTIDTQETVEWMNQQADIQPLTLKVSYPEVVNSLTITRSLKPGDDVHDHGLFVAGLVHAVSPASELRLVRVLNEIGCGDLYMLNEGLARFVGEMKEERGTLEGVVINLSLGVRARTLEGDVILGECGAGNVESPSSGDDITSLCDILSEARNAGAVIVAAAGNESGAEDLPLPPQIPAAYDFAIGVAANNVEREWACFSNAGEVTAPGGDGGPVDPERCASVVHECSGDCAAGVISLVLASPQGADYWPTDYAYWSGTSFSAPLVSGLSALLLQVGVPPYADTPGRQEVPLSVFDTVRNCSARPPNGVISIPATFTDCIP